jgi:hypothetical protein
MGISRAFAALIINEHCYRPLSGRVACIAERKVNLRRPHRQGVLDPGEPLPRDIHEDSPILNDGDRSIVAEVQTKNDHIGEPFF